MDNKVGASDLAFKIIAKAVVDGGIIALSALCLSMATWFPFGKIWLGAAGIHAFCWSMGWVTRD